MTYTIYFIRHGFTETNYGGVLIGAKGPSLRYPLSDAGREELERQHRDYPMPEAPLLYSSPAFRSFETAMILYPGMDVHVLQDLRELDFGDCDGMPASEVNAGGHNEGFRTMALEHALPGGETIRSCRDRAIRAFDRILDEMDLYGAQTAAVVTHSVLMMTMFFHCAATDLPREQLFAPNGMGYPLLFDRDEWQRERRFRIGGMIPHGAQRPDMSKSPYCVPDEE